MTRFRWQWLLPLVQLVLVLTAAVYGTHEYRVTERQKGVYGDNNVLEYFSQNFPAPLERISQGINFPALVLAYPLKGYTNAIVDYSFEYTLVWISLHDMGFFAGVVVFWCWVGWKLDQSQGRSPRHAVPRGLRIAGLTCGFVFATLTGAYALQMILSEWRPERHIGAFGIAWSFALLAYFAWHFTRELWSRNGGWRAG